MLLTVAAFAGEAATPKRGIDLTETRVGPPTINGTVTALRFFFSVTVDRSEVTKPLTFVAEPRKIPIVLSPDEVTRFLEAAPGPKWVFGFFHPLSSVPIDPGPFSADNTVTSARG